ncbi:MarR family transcriptional regulator [Cellulophaga baltica]|uniref:MarR family winged helix-turn-helix transcriptional regulator n=1 Tax=Cellulophaga TaxID=104264 RepID=UPI001C07DF53|nr:MULTISPECIES: MarR family transcriptional regulator [Cellulophaga]MBU2996435.1 MarR family transcriptional regulator [Cellulophaga baltica]MDO6767830.1 MarR family transcriptional regulator [Cellulophaga sp. 1_MG-2023]
MSTTCEQLQLNNQLCFPLYAASRLTTKMYTPHLKPLDITYPQYLVLLALWQYEKMSVKNIGARLFLESNTLTPLLKRLEQKELIHRIRSKTDERTVMVSLSTKGEKLKEQAAEIPLKIQSAFTTEDFNESELISFKNNLVKLLHIIQDKTNNK